MKNLLIAFLFCNLLLASCSSPWRQQQVAGAAAGSATASAVASASGSSPGPITLVGTGALVGALIGASMSNDLDAADKEKAYKAIATGKAATWQNPHSKILYTVIPARNYIRFKGYPYCRQFSASQTTVEGLVRRINRIACMEASGNWQIV